MDGIAGRAIQLDDGDHLLHTPGIQQFTVHPVHPVGVAPPAAIAPTLDAIGCYGQRDEAIRAVFPDYSEGWANKIVIQGGLEGRVNHFVLVVRTPEGEMQEARLPLKQYLKIVNL